MIVALEVEVKIRKGLGPETITRHYPVGYDDIPEETTKQEIEDMAKKDVEEYLSGTEDYPKYGKNWEIIQYHYT